MSVIIFTFPHLNTFYNNDYCLVIGKNAKCEGRSGQILSLKLRNN